MQRMAMLMLAAVPFLMGQMCGVPQTIPDAESNQPSPAQADSTSSTPTARTLSGPGFSMGIPSGFSPHLGYRQPGQTGFMQAYGDGERLIIVTTQTPLPGGPFDFDSSAVRIQAGQLSDSGDFVLRGKICPAAVEGESLAVYALLANGDLLRVEVCPGRPLGADDQDFGTNLLRTIDLEGTDGRPLEQSLWINQPKLKGHTDQGLLVLEDLTVWMLDDAMDSDAYREMRSWQIGSPVHVQGAGEEREMLQIGRWVPVPMRELGLATETAIIAYESSARRVTFANGQSELLIHSRLPMSWQMGDTVLLVQVQSDGWIIRPRNWQSIRM